MAYPEVTAALAALSRVGEARLTGTGACVFAAFDSESEALKAAQRIDADWRTLVVRGLNRSPLLAYLT
jgi:4-diphosphocytidyl-2-C-methyl-D-erythritol kinase